MHGRAPGASASARCPVRRATSGAASSPTRTTRSASCSACPRRCSPRTARSRRRWPAPWPRARAAPRRRPRGLDHRASRGRTAARAEKPVGLVFVGFADAEGQRGPRVPVPLRPRATPAGDEPGRARLGAARAARRGARGAALAAGAGMSEALPDARRAAASHGGDGRARLLRLGASGRREGGTRRARPRAARAPRRRRRALGAARELPRDAPLPRQRRDGRRAGARRRGARPSSTAPSAFEVALGAPHAFPSRAPAARGRGRASSPRRRSPRSPSASRPAWWRPGFPAERRRFRAHLTLGRVRSRRLPALDAQPRDAGALGVHEVVLFRSDLAPRRLPLHAARAASSPRRAVHYG